MKMVLAIVTPSRLDAVEESLQAALDEGDHYRITVEPVDGHGQKAGELEPFRGQMVRPRRIPRVRLMICVDDDLAERTIEAIVRGARSGHAGAMGDGKVFVLPLEECVRIRTGERGPGAL